MLSSKRKTVEINKRVGFEKADPSGNFRKTSGSIVLAALSRLEKKYDISFVSCIVCKYSKVRVLGIFQVTRVKYGVLGVLTSFPSPEGARPCMIRQRHSEAAKALCHVTYLRSMEYGVWNTCLVAPASPEKRSKSLYGVRRPIVCLRCLHKPEVWTEYGELLENESCPNLVKYLDPKTGEHQDGSSSSPMLPRSAMPVGTQLFTSTVFRS